MWWLIVIICIVVGFLIGYFTDFGDVLTGFLYSLLGGIVSLLVLLAFFLLSFSPVESLYSPVNIVSLQDSNTIEGSFVLGSGNIDEELTYTFCYGNETDGFQVKQVVAKNCVIKYTDNQPYYQQKASHFNWFGKLLWGRERISQESYILYVPEDTIITEYNIDLQ